MSIKITTKSSLKSLILSVLLTVPAVSARANYADFGTLLPQGSEMGFILTNTAGTVLAEHNADNMMLPASTLKLVTATAAWLELGPDFRYHTRVFTGEVNNGVAEGDLIIQMSGDPTFSRADLYQLLKQVQLQGIHTIKGQLIFDDQLFYGYDRAKGWPWDDLGVCFSAPASAVMLDGNCVHVALEPKAGHIAVNKSAHIPLNIESNVRYEPMSSFCPLELNVDHQVYRLSGCTNKKTNLALALDEPEDYVRKVIYQQLQQLNISLEGDPDQQQAVTSQVGLHRSATLPKLLTLVLSNSDNLVSDSILRTLGARKYNVGSFQAGISAMRDSLKINLDMDLGSSDLYDGSGLSRYNLISPRTLATLLSSWQQDPRLQPLNDMLPIAGQTGTLRYRKSTAKLNGKLKAKTGTFKQVANLAGIITTKDDQQLVVVQFVNGINGNSADAKAQVSEFEQALLQCIHHRCFSDN
ncbi:D-alanyl-D-alanine carboxypeptidase/D-alanyl-D-alanine-endopeptidase [Ferrimonas lipolytica]|uniref:D-alanyl-D-alanine carboxypeptidase/D-alanyl-D-alanine-endopeptidase n=1 Tax=Ferrimonas lipolytica TaxID=2724191 RepID=A0A6H1UE38_9GAMM|nr:D-alanyl-D-alanine carboxypeptidase/D-alanyl-D-alanine-endopeptidase [Ferrimonas lipolytica]QIZ76603.1 D-alanyl-D-alanine carboxypeptidase/D-alanyl-D-alanine-endopeptidase [Ferrimonas lipolytica]